MNDTGQGPGGRRREPGGHSPRRGTTGGERPRDGGRGAERSGADRQRGSLYRPGQEAREPEPEIDEDVTPQMLDGTARRRLRTLSRSNAEHVAKHLVMAGRLIDIDPEQAHAHARTAVRHAGRVDVVREAMALTAYATERYGEALREIRALRRLSGVDELRPIEADCERGLGRPDRALTVVAEAAAGLPVAEQVELQIVASGARADLDEHETGLIIVEDLLHKVREPELRERLESVRADRLDELGRGQEAAAIRNRLEPSAGPVHVTDLDPEADAAVLPGEESAR